VEGYNIEVCGCINAIDSQSGVLRCVEKCIGHKAFALNRKRGADYYQSIGSIVGDTQQLGSYAKEIRRSLGQFAPAPSSYSLALEIGGGISPYISDLLEAGYQYIGVEEDEWAVEWTKRHYPQVQMYQGSFPDILPEGHNFDLVLMAHCLEHVYNPLQTINEIKKLMAPEGNLYIIVPDDTDKTNPDHYWFFTTESLTTLLGKVGFEVCALDVQHIVPHEAFIYCLARKPK
jgi:SAM-dependent methyltransferase